MVDLGILVAPDGTGPFLETDVREGPPSHPPASGPVAHGGNRRGDRVAAAAFAFLEAAPFRRWAVRSTLTYRQVSHETGSPSTRSGRCWSRWDSPGSARTSRCARTSSTWCAAAPRPGQWDLRPGLARPGRPGPRRGAAADRHRLGRSLPGAVRGAGAGLGRGPGGGHGACRPAERGASTRWPTRPCWPSTGASRSCCGPRASSSGSRTSWSRPASRSGGPGRVPAMSFLDLTATPASPRTGRRRRHGAWPRPWPCWLAGRPASMGVPVKWLGDG